jgi:transcriptional regulator with XRE-family HTH domain
MGRKRLSGAFGKVLRRHRIASGLTQEKLAEAASLHHTYVSLIERGIANVSLDAAQRLAVALDTPASTLVREAEAESPFTASGKRR